MNASPLLSRRDARAFTLVELLITIGLIAVLISILIPVLGQMREREKNIRCTQNLKQIGMGAAAFAADNNGAVLPYALNQPQVMQKYKNAFWYAMVHYYLYPDTPWVSLADNISATRLKPFFCPTTDTLYAINRTCGWSNSSNPSISPWKHYIRLGQGMTEKSHRKPDNPSSWNTSWKPFPLPGGLHETAYFADGRGAFTPENVGDGSSLQFPHHNRCNVLYMDGHVAPIQNPDFANNPELVHEREWINFLGRTPF